MKWNKSRIVNREAKADIVQLGRCPGCGRELTFSHWEPANPFCADCRKEAEAAWTEERVARMSQRKAQEKSFNR